MSSAQDTGMNAQQGYPSLCKNGCGFFSSVDAKGYCSVCYKDYVKKEREENAGSITSRSDEDSVATSLSNLSMEESPNVASVSKIENEQSLEQVSSENSPKPSLEEHTDEKPEFKGDEALEEPKPDQKKKKSRCLSCKKKLGLTGFTCRCGGLYCGIHRYSDKHECNFDYNAMGKKEIAEANPLIVAEKVAKI